MSYQLQNEKTEPALLLTIPLRGVVVFPGLTASFEIGRALSVATLRKAAETGGTILLVPQIDAEVEDPVDYDLAFVGVEANLVSVLRLTNGNYQVIAEGLHRVKRLKTHKDETCMLSETLPVPQDDLPNAKTKQTLRTLWRVFDDYMQYGQRPSDDIVNELKKTDDPGILADFLASNFVTSFEERYTLLEETDSVRRAEQLRSILEKRIGMMELENSIQARVRYRLHGRQREQYLREELEAIRGELGMTEEGNDYEDGNEYTKRIADADLPEEVAKKLNEEAAKLAKMPFGTAEATVIHNYLDVCLDLPWRVCTEDRIDIPEAQKILDEDHDGIKRVKERILEFLSVKQLKPDAKGQILCLVGPPGVGKTSVARSVAGRPTATLPVCRWAASATKPRSEDTAKPTSAQCPDALSTRSNRQAAPTPSSCSTSSIN